MSGIETKNFSFDHPKNGGVSICLLGSTRSGKTTFLKHLLDKYFKKHFKILMSNSIHNEIYKDIKDCVESPIYHPKIVKEGYDINKSTKNHYDFLYILDDVVSAKFDKELLKLLAIYRNSNLSCILSIQSPVLLNSATRGNLNYVCLGRMNSDEMIEKVIKMYLNSYLDGKMPEKMRQYKRMTEDHYWFIINNIDGTIYRTKINVD
jgi:Ni2+-binding GTPase involved in maturation of urease and hydrogenase